MKKSEINPDHIPAYYSGYINLAPDVDLLPALEKGHNETVLFFENLPPEKWSHTYAPEKWSPKQLLLHLIDAERVFAYRSLYFARANGANLQGFDQDEFVENSGANNRTPSSLISEYKHVRKSTISLFENLTPTGLLKAARANNVEISVAAMGFVVC
ncbi:MAG: DinB family protein, partial [Marinirhabdus sp.]